MENPNDTFYVVSDHDFDPKLSWQIYNDFGFSRPKLKSDNSYDWNYEKIRDFIIIYINFYKKSPISVKMYAKHQKMDDSIELLTHIWENSGVMNG